jgi:hypothetical protein
VESVLKQLATAAAPGRLLLLLRVTPSNSSAWTQPQNGVSQHHQTPGKVFWLVAETVLDRPQVSTAHILFNRGNCDRTGLQQCTAAHTVLLDDLMRYGLDYNYYT